MPARWLFRPSSHNPTTTRRPTRQSRPTRRTSLSYWRWSLRCGRSAITCWAAMPPARLGVFGLLLRTDNQAVSWLRTKRDMNRFLARRLDEIEEFHFDMEHVPGRLNPADPLTRRRFPGPDAALLPSRDRHGGGRRARTGRGGRFRVGCGGRPLSGGLHAARRRPDPPRRGRRRGSPPGPPSLTALTQSARPFLAPDFVDAWQAPLDPFFGPMFKGAAASGPPRWAAPSTGTAPPSRLRRLGRPSSSAAGLRPALPPRPR